MDSVAFMYLESRLYISVVPLELEGLVCWVDNAAPQSAFSKPLGCDDWYSVLDSLADPLGALGHSFWRRNQGRHPLVKDPGNGSPTFEGLGSQLLESRVAALRTRLFGGHRYHDSREREAPRF